MDDDTFEAMGREIDRLGAEIEDQRASIDELRRTIAEQDARQSKRYEELMAWAQRQVDEMRNQAREEISAIHAKLTTPSVN